MQQRLRVKPTTSQTTARPSRRLLILTIQHGHQKLSMHGRRATECELARAKTLSKLFTINCFEIFLQAVPFSLQDPLTNLE